jgi:CheY-like chemotaxis protein
MAKRILIADDSLTIQKAFAMTFAGEDVTLLAARSADEGLTIARQARPELVIADAVMPGRSGYDLCSAIKSDPGLRGVPVYILTSSQNPYDEARGRQSGADGQFTKPFESVAFVDRVTEAIAKGTAAPAPMAVPAFRSTMDLATAAPAVAAVSARSASVQAPTGAPPSVQASVQASVDDDYGEISIEDAGPQPVGSPASAAGRAASEITPPPSVPLAPPRPAMPMGTSTFAASTGLRPSLIPGLRPGAAPPPARPGTSMPARPVAAPGFTAHPATVSPAPAPHAPPSHAAASHGPAYPHPPVSPGMVPTPLQIPALRPAHAPAPAAIVAPGPARTLVGLPATGGPPARFGAPAAPARPPTQPIRPMDARTPPPITPSPLFPAGPSAPAAVRSKIDEKVAEIAAKGAEYEVIAKLSREIIERIVWEVVPELADVIIREELQKRGRI